MNTRVTIVSLELTSVFPLTVVISVVILLLEDHSTVRFELTIDPERWHDVESCLKTRKDVAP